MPVAENQLSEAVITFAEGVPGLPEFRRFVVVRPEGLEPIVLLQSVDDEHLTLPALPVGSVIENYRLQVDDSDRHELELDGDADTSKLVCLAVLTLPGEQNPPAVNLFAPIVINPENRRARQVLQLASGYPSVYPLGAG